MVIGVLALVAGLALVVWGAELFTDGAIHVAARLAISTFFVGAAVSGFEPENLASGAAAALGGLPQIALGTVIGSTIFLLTAALGLALLVAPMAVRIPREGAYRTDCVGTDMHVVVWFGCIVLSAKDRVLAPTGPRRRMPSSGRAYPCLRGA